MRLRDAIADVLARERLVTTYGSQMAGVTVTGSEDDERMADAVLALLRERATERCAYPRCGLSEGHHLKGCDFYLNHDYMPQRILVLPALGEDTE